MPLLNHIHRDMLCRVLRHGDYVVWSNGKYKQKMKIATVIDTTPEKVKIFILDENRQTISHPENLIVISAQVMANIDGNVGANQDLEALRITREERLNNG